MAAEQKNHVVTGWLAGLLSQVDPKQFPEIDSLIGPSDKKEVVADPQESSHNARLWGMWLGQQNKAGGK